MKITATKEGNAGLYLQQIGELLKHPQAMWKVAGRAVANQVRKHLRGQNNKPNKLGGTRTNFYNEVAEATGNPELDGDGVSITIADPRFAIQYYGGDIVAKEAQALTIPIHALAHGRRASVFEEETGADLFQPRGKNVLMAILGGDAVPIYALRKRVTVPKNPTALPTQESMEAVAVEQADKHLTRETERGGLIGQ